MLRSATFRIALAWGAAFGIATLLLGATVYVATQRALERQVDDRLSAEYSALAADYRHDGEAKLRAIIAGREHSRAADGLGYGLFAPDGRRVAGALDLPRPAPGWQRLSFRDRAGNGDEARALAGDLAPDRRLVVAADLDPVDDIQHLILMTLAATLAAVVMIGMLGAIGLSLYLRKRLAVIAGGAEAIIGGDLSQRIPVGRRNDEFDRLGLVLNIMLDRIAGLLDNLQQVSSDIAHDLRMPLTRLRGQLEQGLEGGDHEAAMERAIEQTDQLLDLFGSILRLSEIEAGALRQGFGRIDLARLAAEIGESYAPAIEDGGRRFVLRIDPTPAIDGDRDLLAQALINLLDNAQVHTPAGTCIELRVFAVADGIRLIVADDGPGVAAADRSRIVRRFARLETSRHRPGHGLGLSLVAAIARIHGAGLAFADNRPGLVVTLSFRR